jgi:hypothetical protein
MFSNKLNRGPSCSSRAVLKGMDKEGLELLSRAGSGFIATPRDLADSRDLVPIRKPVIEGFMHRPYDRAAPGRGNMGQDCIPRRHPMVSLHPAVGFGKGKVLYRHTIVFDQRMVLKGRR